MSSFEQTNNLITEDEKPQQQVVVEEEKKVSVVDVVVDSENTALNLLVSFITIAQRRGVYSIEESSKIWECIQKFQKAK